MSCVRVVAKVCAVLLAFAAFGVEAQCIRVVDVERELPHEVDTPAGTHLSYFYNLETERYFVVAARGGESLAPRGPYVLTRGCQPATLKWESDRFVVLTKGCGTFCWEAEVIPLEAGLEPRAVLRPLVFDRERNWLASYPQGGGRIEIANLVTGHVQHVSTPAACPSSHDTCFVDLRFTADGIEFEWRYWELRSDGEHVFPPRTISVALAAELRAVTE